MNFREKYGKELLIFDGGLGTMLQDRGLALGELPENLNITNPALITEIHSLYLQAGADLITTNTFGANALKFENVEEIISAAVANAKTAIANTSKDAFIALDVGPLGKLLKPYGELEFEKAYDLFAEQIKAGTKAGADLILIETMGDLYEAKCAVLAAKENSDLPILVSMIFDEKGKTLTGADAKTVIFTLESLRVDGIGMNCGLGPEQMSVIAEDFAKYSSLPYFIQPNAGLPVSVNGVTTYNVTPDGFTDIQKENVLSGAAAVGGCCGTTPDFIKMLCDKCRGLDIKKAENKGITAVTSYSKSVEFSDKPLVIGERINPTGKKHLKEALKNNDLEYIYGEGIKQTDLGAHILDVNVGLPGIDEPLMLKNAVCGLQSILTTPLQIDTSDPAALEASLRVYNGKALINSVNGKKESMDMVFPLVVKYGGAVVGLTLDENGIPDTAEERVEIARKIIKTAESYGIDKKDIVIDPLCLTISTDPNNAQVTLDALNIIRNELGVHTVLGISNISFGLPNREAINTAFFTLAMSKGLSAGIINPMSAAMMNAYYSYSALSGFDTNFEEYIANATDIKNEEKENADSLKDVVIRGLKEKAREMTSEELKNKKPLEIINEILVPALDEVGKGFENGKLFLPSLLMSAETASECFEVIKADLKKNNAEKKSENLIVIATVKGDIHDIGKNIVKVLLENYGFDVIDLGKDVPPELIVNTVKEKNVKLVGLSALMTTTVVSMEETIKQLRDKCPGTAVMVGGAVLNQEYADEIGADFYGKDAVSSVKYAQKFFENKE
ncbi:MAG: homocysteine S-methyltransferase family protein [Clostridiales bacterium]|nr:homocysteine S-methyltransferase family protein [Clostridiales bacterium]